MNQSFRIETCTFKLSIQYPGSGTLDTNCYTCCGCQSIQHGFVYAVNCMAFVHCDLQLIQCDTKMHNVSSNADGNAVCKQKCKLKNK